MNDVKQVSKPIALCLAGAVMLLAFVLMIAFEQRLLGAITIASLVAVLSWRSLKR